MQNLFSNFIKVLVQQR